jgi:hypothetical protein
MSALTGVSGSAGVTYATQLAQTSALKRSLYNLGSAIQSGDLTAAGSTLNAMMKANPQYALASTGSKQPQDPINQDFQNLAKAISNNQVDTAKSAWAQLKGDLAKNGVTDIGNGKQLSAQAVAQSRASINQTIMANLGGTTSDGASTVATLLGGNDNSSAGTNPLNAMVTQWLAYKANGNSQSAPGTGTTGSGLNGVA